MADKRIVDRWWFSTLLWMLAVVLMLSTAIYQRKTGPTHPATGTAEVGELTVDYDLVRSGTTGEDAEVELPFQEGLEATLVWRRFPTDDPWTEQPMTRDGERLLGHLPHQPSAGKVEYSVRAEAEGASLALPPHEAAVLRFKDAVPTWALVPHVLAMFFGILWGMRTVMEALAGRRGLRWQTFTTLGLLLVGGMILGPVVQK